MRQVSLSVKGTEALVALCRYVYQHGNAARDARWIAGILVHVADEDVRDPFVAGEDAVRGLARARALFRTEEKEDEA